MNFFKGRAILWLLIPLAFVVAFLWESSVPKKPNFIRDTSNPDYYLVNTQSIEFKADGLAERTFTSDKTLHYTFKQETEMENPQLVFNNDNDEVWTMNASHATSKELSEELLLTNGVILSIERKNGQRVTLTTDNLTVDFATENAFTDAAVTLTNDYYQLTALGMSADLRANLINFTSQVVTEEL